MQRAVEFLESKDIEIEARPTAKISAEVYQTLIDEFETDMNKKQRSQEVAVIKEEEKEAMRKDLETRQSDRKEAAEAKAKATEASEEPEVIKGKTQLTDSRKWARSIWMPSQRQRQKRKKRKRPRQKKLLRHRKQRPKRKRRKSPTQLLHPQKQRAKQRTRAKRRRSKRSTSNSPG